MRKPSMKGRNPASLRDGPSVTSRTRFVPSRLVSGLEMGAEGWETRALPPLPVWDVWEAASHVFPALATVMMNWQSGSCLDL